MIVFDKKTHTYIKGHKALISVTQLLAKHNLAPNYDKVDEELLKQASERGTLIHEEISHYLLFGEKGTTKELQQFIKKNKGNTSLGSEMIVYNDLVAGTYDYLYQNSKGEIVRVDFKTTSTKHIDSVSWQLSLYDYLDTEYKADRFELWHFSDKGLKIIPIDKKDTQEIERLLTCEKLGLPYYPKELVLSQNELAKISELNNIIVNAKTTIKKAETTLNELKQAIIKAMEENKIYSFKNDEMVISYVAPHERTIIDSDRLQKELPQVYEDYSKTTPIKASLKITIKEK